MALQAVSRKQLDPRYFHGIAMNKQRTATPPPAKEHVWEITAWQQNLSAFWKAAVQCPPGGQSTATIDLATSAMKKIPDYIVLYPRSAIISTSAACALKICSSPRPNPLSLHWPSEFILLDSTLLEFFFFPPWNSSSMLFNMMLLSLADHSAKRIQFQTRPCDRPLNF